MVQDILSVLIKQLPSAVIVIVGLAMVLFGSTKKFIGGGNIDDNTSKRLSMLGWVLFYIGLVSTLIIVGFTFWENLLPYQKYLSEIWTFISQPKTILNIVLLGLGVILLNLIRIVILNASYKIKTTPIIDELKTPNEINIQVENIGKGLFHCVARLTKVTRKSLKGGKTNPIDINKLNPKGLYLDWASGEDNETLQRLFPRTACLLRKWRDDEVAFCFSNDEQSPFIEEGYYTITVDFYRWEGKTYVDLFTFEETLKVSLNGTKWMDKKESPNNKKQVKRKK